MMKAIRRPAATPSVSPAVLKLVPRPPVPHRDCQSVADGLNGYKNQALHGCYVGAIVLMITAEGEYFWEAFGSLGKYDAATTAASSCLTAAVYKNCYR
jgi:hypothetical protein